jgi:peptidyl-tRNA hydrolase, PTH1 family
MKLLVGLGNPGPEYANNRHNVGFMALDVLASRHALPPWRRKFAGLVTEGDLGGARTLLLKPQTYMNESGRAVQEAAQFLKLPLGDIIVLHDELDLAPGKVRLKTGGGNAGHNGLRSLTAHLGNDYTRVRIGIGHPGSKDLVHHWVLGNFAKADRAWLTPLLEAMSDAAPRLAAGDTERFQTDVARLMAAGQSDQSTPRPPAAPPKSHSARSHPAGERAAKQQNALAANLKKWLAAKTKRD